MKTLLYITAVSLLLTISYLGSYAQCRPQIQDQGNNNSFNITLVFYDVNGIPLGSCNCNIAGNSGNMHCPDGCAFTVPGSNYTNIKLTDEFGNECLYDNRGLLIMPLPIHLLTFNATASATSIELLWRTASETNNDYFTLEKTSDFKEFETVAKIKAAGNSTTEQLYSTTDNKPIQGVNYYRLKQTDYDGKTTISDYSSVTFIPSVEFKFNVFPNPSATDNINFSICADMGEEILIEINDVTGKCLYYKTVVTENSGENNFTINSGLNMPSGMYMILAVAGQITKNKVLIIQ